MSAWAPQGMGPGQVESVIKVESGRWSPGRAGARASPVPMLTLPIAELVDQGVITNPNYPNWSCTVCTQWKHTYHLCPASECIHCVCTVCSFWRRGRVRNCQFKNTSGLVRTKFGMDIMVNLQYILYRTPALCRVRRNGQIPVESIYYGLLLPVRHVRLSMLWPIRGFVHIHDAKIYVITHK